MKDPILDIADQQLINLSADVQVQLERGAATRPVLWMLATARRKAAEALAGMVDVSAYDPKAILAFQAEIKLYNDMVMACRELMQRGDEADRRINDTVRDDLQELIMTEEQQRMYAPGNGMMDS